jgi:hypothetical protein
VEAVVRAAREGRVEEAVAGLSRLTPGQLREAAQRLAEELARRAGTPSQA